jgi:hypothetical protein
MTAALVNFNDERIPELTPPPPPAVDELRTPSEALAYLLSGPHEMLRCAAEVRTRLQRELAAVTGSGFNDRDPSALLEIHKILYMLYDLSFGNPLSPAVAHERSPWIATIRETLESAWLADELSWIQRELPSAPFTAHGICAWFGAHARKNSDLDTRVVEFLAREASRDQFATFILSDGYLNYRFYDALVLAMLHYSETVKSEIIRHMWDECGGDTPLRAHTRQFTRTLQQIGRVLPSPPVWDDWRPYAGFNLYFLLGLNRRHYFKAVGSLAMPELFDPDRDRAVVDGLRRLGFHPEYDFEYYNSHIEVDEGHGPCWLDHVIRPIVESQPEAALDLAVGGALRMVAMSRYNEYLADRFELGEER